MSSRRGEPPAPQLLSFTVTGSALPTVAIAVGVQLVVGMALRAVSLVTLMAGCIGVATANVLLVGHWFHVARVRTAAVAA